MPVEGAPITGLPEGVLRVCGVARVRASNSRLASHPGSRETNACGYCARTDASDHPAWSLLKARLASVSSANTISCGGRSSLAARYPSRVLTAVASFGVIRAIA